MPTTNLALPLIEAGQSQKHVTHNEALVALDAIVMLTVLSASISAPPGSPPAGARYIVPAGATGAWAGKAKQVAAWAGGAWVFYAPAEGWQAWNVALGAGLVYSGGAWISAALFPSVGIGGAAPDSTNALAFYGTNALFNSGGSIDLTLNKAAAGGDASFSFKRAWSVRSLFGLLASDDFSIKVSPDGSTFFEALRIAAATGIANLITGLTIGGQLAFHRGNVLGTVSQSAGVPTGAVIERGSNANGEFVKFADGTMICTGTTSQAGLAISNALCGGYRSNGVTLTFPATFIAAPKVTAHSTGLTALGTLTNSVATSSFILCFTAVTSQAGATRTADYVAVGRWFT